VCVLSSDPSAGGIAMARRIIAGVFGIALFVVAPVARAAYSPATTSGWFIVAGRVVGFNGAQFRTDVWLFNPDSQNSAVATLIFHGQVSNGGGAPAPISS